MYVSLIEGPYKSNIYSLVERCLVMNIVICLVIIAITGILLMKRYQPQPVLIGMGILMMIIAYEANWIEAILVES